MLWAKPNSVCEKATHISKTTWKKIWSPMYAVKADKTILYQW